MLSGRLYIQGVAKKGARIKEEIPWSLPSYVIKKLIKLVFLYTLLPLGTFLTKNGDSKSQIRSFHVISEFKMTIFDKRYIKTDNIFRTENHIFESQTESLGKCIQK